jgi:hypothetical protein
VPQRLGSRKCDHGTECLQKAGQNRALFLAIVIFFISPMFLYSVHVLIALTLGKYRAIDRSTNPKGELQLSFF